MLCEIVDMGVLSFKTRWVCSGVIVLREMELLPLFSTTNTTTREFIERF